MPNQKKTLSELVQDIPADVTLVDILTGYAWYRAELKRSSEKGKKYREAKKMKKLNQSQNETEVESKQDT